jgi:hypothetical protein
MGFLGVSLACGRSLLAMAQAIGQSRAAIGINLTGCEFFGIQMLLDVAMAYVKHGTRKQGSEKNAWHAMAVSRMACA